MKGMTKQDMVVLSALAGMSAPESPGIIALAAKLSTSSRRETAARHLIKLTSLGMAHKSGSRMFPKWEATFEGRLALSSNTRSGE